MNEKLMTKKITIVVFVSLFLLSILVSVKYAVISPSRDFATFYCAGRIILDSTISNDAVYNYETMRDVSISSGIKVSPCPYLYSIAAAYIFTPFSVFSYEVAKVIFNITNVFAYLATVAISLFLGGTKGVGFVRFMIMSLIWVPFLFNQFWLQSNAIVSLLVALAILFATRERSTISGIFFGVATLIKIFPFAIVMVIGLKNWRIFAVCLTVFVLSFFIEGSTGWLSAIHDANHANYTEIYHILTNYNFIWYVCFVILVGGITAIVSYRARSATYASLLSFAIPAVLLVWPVVGGYYLVLLIISFMYIFAIGSRAPKLIQVTSFLSFIVINVTMFLYDSFLLGLLFLWVTLALWIVRQPKKQFHPANEVPL